MSTKRSGIPPELDQLIYRATNSDPDARPRDASEFHQSLTLIAQALDPNQKQLSLELDIPMQKISEKTSRSKVKKKLKPEPVKELTQEKPIREITAGTKVRKDFTYIIKDNFRGFNYAIVAYLMNADTNEILQVIMQDA
jgi:serine/threonine-protein kinase